MSELFDHLRTVAFRREFVTIGGSVNAALMLSQLCYWTPRCPRNDGWIYKTQKQWEDETGMGRREQETARWRLLAAGLIEERLMGTPAKVHFRIKIKAIDSALSMAESAKPVWRNAPNLNGGISQTITESSSENTAESREGDRGITPHRPARKPKHRYPKTEAAMRKALTRRGIEYNPDYDGGFFDQMTKSQWRVNGELVHDWIKLYQSRAEAIEQS